MVSILWIVPPVVIMLSGKWTSLGSTATQVDPEIVNGLATLSGIVFAFHLAFFKPSTEGHKALLLVEVALLGLVGVFIFLDFSLLGYISSRALYAAYLSLTYNLASIAVEIAAEATPH